MAKILIIEDERDLVRGLCDNLEIEGHEPQAAYNGTDGLARLRKDKPDLVILDLMLPDTDGYRVLHELRSEGSDTPVLLLTARGQETDKVRGFQLGADDYVTKPFGLLELLARLEALLRRSGHGKQSQRFRFGEVAVDLDSRQVRRAGEPLSLPPKEFELLASLYRHEGEAVSRQTLLREVWGHRGRVVTRTVDTHVAELRRKIEPDPNNPQHILTVRKYGYRFCLKRR